MNGVLLGVTIASLAAGVVIVVRVKREYEGPAVLSDLTVAAVWILYSVIFLAVTVAAVVEAWPIGLPSSLAISIGCVLIVVGLVLEVGGLVSMASFHRMSGMQPDRLITSGAFRFSRNPQNVGLGTMMLGIAIVGDSWLALLAVACFWLLFRAYVGFEEAHLARAFGDEYEGYLRRTPRFLGRPSHEAPAG
jgi:protein-S-isoprenylcysteine O-methyltransferase Ste14